MLLSQLDNNPTRIFEINGCRIEMREEIFPFGSKNIQEIQEFALHSVERLQGRMNGQAVAVFGTNGILNLCMSSRRKSRLQDYVTKSTKKAAKQLSGSRPGYVWTHFIDLRNDHIQQLARESDSRGATGLDGISQCVFDSDSRQHLFALGYSAIPPVFRSQRVEGSNLVTKLGEEGALIIHKNRRSRFSLPENNCFP